MRASKTKSLLSIIASVASVVLILVYWLAPAPPGSHRLHVLLIDCIPDAVIVLIAIPIVYWLFYRRGLTNMGDCPLFSEDSDVEIPERRLDQCRTPAQEACPHVLGAVAGGEEPVVRRDVLLVLEAGDDSAAGSPGSDDAGKTLAALNAAIHTAESRAMPVLMAREDPAGGHDLYQPPGSTVFAVDAGLQAAADGALENPALRLVVSHRKVRTVYVAGFAPVETVQATCRAVLQRGKRAVLLEAASTLASDDVKRAEIAWRQLGAEGLARIDRLPPAGDESDAS